MNKYFLFAFLSSAPIFAFIPSDPLVGSAEYYFEKHQFVLSMKAWEDLNQKYPLNPQIIIKLADHQLLLTNRSRARETLVAALQTNKLEAESQKLLQNHLNEINTKFVTDEGQSNYLQAQARVNQRDCAKAESLLETANRYELNNSAVLDLMAKCQLEQHEGERYTATVRTLLSTDPTNWVRRLRLVESLLHDSKATQALEVLGNPAAIPKTNAAQLAYGVTLYETGNWDASVRVLNTLAQGREGVNPIVFYYLGKTSERSNKPTASSYFNRFVVSARERKDRTSWDPYKIEDRMARLALEAKPG